MIIRFATTRDYNNNNFQSANGTHHLDTRRNSSISRVQSAKYTTSWNSWWSSFPTRRLAGDDDDDLSKCWHRLILFQLIRLKEVARSQQARRCTINGVFTLLTAYSSTSSATLVFGWILSPGKPATFAKSIYIVYHTSRMHCFLIVIFPMKRTIMMLMQMMIMIMIKTTTRQMYSRLLLVRLMLNRAIRMILRLLMIMIMTVGVTPGAAHVKAKHRALSLAAKQAKENITKQSQVFFSF